MARFLYKTNCLIVFALLVFLPVKLPAQTSISLNIYYNTYPGQSSYYIQVPITTTNAIATYDEVISPNTNFASTVDSNGFGGNSTYVDITSFDQLAQAVTNGTWQFITDVGAPTQKNYTFKVTGTGFVSNTMPAFLVTYPMPEEAITDTDPTFTWENGPTNYTALGVTVHNTDYSFYEGVGIDPQYYSSWNFGEVLAGNDPNYYLDVNYETSATNYLTISTPVMTNGQPLPGWSSTSTFNLTENNSTDTDGDGVHFTLTTGSGGGGTIGGHTNLAYYSFEDDDVFAEDFSGNGNSIDGVSWIGTPPYITNYAEAGSYACAFTGSGWLDAPTNLVATLAESFSVSLWAETTNVHDNNNETGDQGAGIVAGNSDQVIPMSQTGTLLAFLTGGNNPDTLQSVTPINTGAYVHMVVTRDMGTGEKKIYINGQLDSSDYGATGQLTSGSAAQLFIGFNTSFSGGFAGVMDEIQIYSGVLSASDVNYLYNNPGTTVPNTAGVAQDFNAALGTTNLSWETSGTTDWFVETTNTANGVSAAQSGSVTNEQSSVLSVSVTGPGSLTFYWSSIANDPNQGFFCEFDLDGNYQDSISGDTSWYQDGTFPIPSGQHTLSWTAYADGDTDPTQAAFLDEVNYTADVAPVITQNPFSQTNYPGGPVWLSASATGTPAPTWQWYETSTGAIPGATSSYYFPTNAGTDGVAGTYYAVASNPAGSTSTTEATVAFVNTPQPEDWAVALKSPLSAEYGTNVIKDYYGGCTVDSLGNVCVADQYVGDVNVESNFVTINTLTAVGAFGGSALIKNDPTGHVIWAAGLTNNDPGSYSYGLCVALAPSNGCYLASDLVGTNWLGTNRYANTGGDSILLSRFDSNGNAIWSKFIGTNATVFTTYNDLVSDPAGNITLAGFFSGTVNFGGSNLTSSGFGGFIAQYNSNGAIRWAQAIAGLPEGLAYNTNGQLYVAFSATVSGGATSLVIGSLSNLTDRAWGVAALNAATGQAIWERGVGDQFGANTTGFLDDYPLLSVYGSDLYVIGTAYGSTAVFSNLTVSLTGGGGQYFARYDTNGNAQVGTSFGGNTTMPWASAADASGVYMSGDFDDYSYFGDYLIAAPEYSPSYLGANYFTQPFVAKFDRNGNPQWALNGLSSLLANFRGVATAANGVWASGINYVPDANEPTVFGTNNVYSDSYLYNFGFGETAFFTQSGLLTKINETPVASAVTLLNAKTVGANFQFQFQSQAGFTNTILYSTNLAAHTWLTNSTVVGDGTVKTVDVPLTVFGSSKDGFVRVVSW